MKNFLLSFVAVLFLSNVSVAQDEYVFPYDGQSFNEGAFSLASAGVTDSPPDVFVKVFIAVWRDGLLVGQVTNPPLLHNGISSVLVAPLPAGDYCTAWYYDIFIRDAQGNYNYETSWGLYEEEWTVDPGSGS